MSRAVVPCLILLVFAAMPARADDKADCSAGMTMIRAEIAKKPGQTTLTKLQTALRVAEREFNEAEFDECLDAIEDARKALRQ